MKIEENYKRRIKTLHFITVVTCSKNQTQFTDKEKISEGSLVVMHSNDTKRILNNKEKNILVYNSN
jgi:hypothetical protein